MNTSVKKVVGVIATHILLLYLCVSVRVFLRPSQRQGGGQYVCPFLTHQADVQTIPFHNQNSHPLCCCYSQRSQRDNTAISHLDVVENMLGMSCVSLWSCVQGEPVVSDVRNIMTFFPIKISVYKSQFSQPTNQTCQTQFRVIITCTCQVIESSVVENVKYSEENEQAQDGKLEVY